MFSDKDNGCGVDGAAAAATGVAPVRVVEQTSASADAGVWQDKFYSPRGLVVTGQLGGDPANLFVAGHRQERRRATVGLHPDHVQIGFRVGQFGSAVREYAATRVDFGSISGAIWTGACKMGSSSTRISDRNDKSGRNPVSTTT